MSVSPLAFIELFVVLAFALGWLILEYVAGRTDSCRERESDTAPPKPINPENDR